MRTVTLLGMLLVASTATAQLRLHPLFGDKMVWPRDRKVPVIGIALPGEKVEVHFRNQKRTGVADKSGWFRIVLDEEPAGQPGVLHVLAKSGEIHREDIRVGDVWLCSGQSNMFWPLSRAKNGKRHAAVAKNDDIRLFKVNPFSTTLPLRSPLTGAWLRCETTTALQFSAVAFHFGKALNKSLDVPIGLVQSAVGGTPVEAWTSPQALADKDLRMVHERWDRLRRTFERRQRTMQDWVANGKAEGKKKPPTPRLNRFHAPAGLYNAMIAPLQDFPFRGVIWYQGESNCRRAHEYRVLFASMISDWRQQLQPDLPFLFVQIAPFHYRGMPRTALAELWESQRLATRMKDVAMAPTMDLGNLRDIHPRDKASVGQRLANCALAIAYGKPTPHHAPRVDKVVFEDGKALVTIANSGTKLSLRGDGPAEFTLAGLDQKFHAATAKLIGKNRIEVTCPQVASPTALRHAWHDRAAVNLFSSHGLPLLPHRTDAWPNATQGIR